MRLENLKSSWSTLSDVQKLAIISDSNRNRLEAFSLAQENKRSKRSGSRSKPKSKPKTLSAKQKKMSPQELLMESLKKMPPNKRAEFLENLNLATPKQSSSE